MNLTQRNKVASRLYGAAPQLIVFLLAFLIWLPAIFGGLVWDDYLSVLLTPQRWNLWNIGDYFLDPNAIYLRPLPPLTFYIDQALWGVDGLWGWHLSNILLHAFNAMLITIVTRPFGKIGSIAAGLIFALHPIVTETVGWISARPDLLLTAFLLVSAWLFLKERKGLSAVVFLCALLSKEIAVTFPVLLTGWLIIKRRSVKEAGWHWLVLAVYLVYRFFALSGFKTGGEWNADVAGWLWKPWFAFAYPIPLPAQGWPSPGDMPLAIVIISAVVCTVVAIVIIRQWRRAWPLAAALIFAMLPLITVFQLGPSFQFGRYLYWPAVIWGIMVGFAFHKYFRWRYSLLVLYLIILAVMAVPPRIQFHQASTAGTEIIKEALVVMPQATQGTRLWVEGMPQEVHGWKVFGNYLQLTLNRAYGYHYDRENPAVEVVDARWEYSVGNKVPPPGDGDTILAWDGEKFTELGLAEWANRYIVADNSPVSVWPPDLPVDALDFGSMPLSLFEASGFKWNETDGTITWNWAVNPVAEVHLPLDTSGDRAFTLRMMSAVDNNVNVVVNGAKVGEFAMAGGFQWQEFTVHVPRNAWSKEAVQLIRFEFTNHEQGNFVAFDQMAISP